MYPRGLKPDRIVRLGPRKLRVVGKRGHNLGNYTSRASARNKAPSTYDAEQFWCDAVKRTSDPTGTLDIRRRFRAIAQMRFRKVRTVVQAAVVNQDVLGLKVATTSPLAMAGSTGNRELGFQTWLDNLLKKVVVEDGTWMRAFMQSAYGRAVARAIRLTGKNVRPDDATETIDALAVLCLTELQGICEAVSQRIMRAATQAWLHNETPKQAFTDMDRALNVVGITRSSAMIELMVVKSFTTGTLDQFEMAGTRRVGIVPELLPPRTRDAHMDAGEFEEEKHPRAEGGKFAESEGVSPASLTEKYGPPVAKEGGVTAYKGERHGAEHAHSVNREAVPRVDLKLYRGKEDLKEFGHIKSHVEAPQRGQGGPAIVSSYREKLRFELTTPEGGGNFKSVKEAMRKAEFYRHLRNERIRARKAARKDNYMTDAPRGFRGSGPGSRSRGGEGPSRSTIGRIRRAQKSVEELGEVNVETAGDEDVCPICEDIEADNPHTIDEARSLVPAHPWCRCAFVPLNDRDDEELDF